MTTKPQNLTKLFLIAGGICLFMIVKYRKNIRYFMKTKCSFLREYANNKLKDFDVEIINDVNKCQEIIAKLKMHCIDYPVLGFDCEWVSIKSERRKIAIIQLCSSSGLCALIRISKFSMIPSSLIELLEDHEILKCGVACNNDAKYLLQDYNINVRGTLELRLLALLAGLKPEGLGKLSKTVLGIDLDKSSRVRCSDWEIETLSQEQIDYAAKDAFHAIEIFRNLYNAIMPDKNDADSIRRFCEYYTDIPFNKKFPHPAPIGNNEFLDKNLLSKNTTKSTRSYSSRTTPLYHNCKLLAPDGEILCAIDRQKAAWYVKKGLGTEEVLESTYTVRLNFEPAGRAVGEIGEYYRSIKENRCVVCGETENLIRKNVIPREYRKFFPNIMKEKTSHDVLLLCIPCHKRSNMSDLSIRRLLEKKCNAPISVDITTTDAAVDRKLINGKRLARALFKLDNIPEQRKNELRKLLENAYPGQEINEEFAQNLLTTEKTRFISSTKSHGELVVNRFKETEGLVKLETLWRCHFLDSMKPKFMPCLWDVNHNGNKLKIRADEGRVDISDLKIAGVDATVMRNQKTKDACQYVSNTSSLSDPKDDLSLDCESFHSAKDSIADNDLDVTLTEDRFFTDATSARSFYETVRSDGSTLDDFQSFTSSSADLTLYDSDKSDSHNLSADSDTEVDD